MTVTYGHSPLWDTPHKGILVESRGRGRDEWMDDDLCGRGRSTVLCCLEIRSARVRANWSARRGVFRSTHGRCRLLPSGRRKAPPSPSLSARYFCPARRKKRRGSDDTLGAFVCFFLGKVRKGRADGLGRHASVRTLQQGGFRVSRF